MPFKDTAIAQAWRRANKIRLRDKLRAERLANPRPRRSTGPLHLELGMKTFVYRQAVLPDFSRRTKVDPVSRTQSFSHLYRENITLACGWA